MPKVHTNGIDIYYETTGAGPPLLLIAGVGYGLWFWHKVAPTLADYSQVIAFDNRGAGQSDKPDGPYTVPMMAADTAGLLDKLGVQGAAVLGHSLGGYIAQELVLTRSDPVRKLILAATNHGGPNAVQITPEALEVLTNREGDPLELIRRGIAIAAAPGFAGRRPEVAEELLAYRLTNPVPPAQYQAQVMAGAAMITTSYEDRLHEIHVPTLILFGEHDKVVPPGNAELLADKVAGAQVRILAGVGHIFPVEDPAATVAALLDFLTESGS